MNRWQLTQRQKLPIEVKIEISSLRIRQWYEKNLGDVYISFSGGKDSTVLLHLVRSIYPDVTAVFVDTGLEYPELKNFVKTVENVIWIKPKMNFKSVIDKYGYPIVSKDISLILYKLKNNNLSDRYKNYLLNGDERGNIGTLPKKWHYLIDEDIKISNKCCDVMKKRPFEVFEKKTGLKPFTGVIAQESRQRTRQYLQHSCNSPKGSTPLGFWTEQDILSYIKEYNLQISSVYGQIYKENDKYDLTGVKRTGCIFCCYGVHMEQYPNRFQRLQLTHKNLHNYCLNSLNLKNVLDLIGVDYKLKKVTKEKYKIKTKTISVRVNENKFNTIKKIHGNIKNTEIIDKLIDYVYESIDKRKKYNNQISLFSGKCNKVDKAKYKINTKKINTRVNEKKFNMVKAFLQIENNTKIIDYLIDEKIKSVGQIL